MCSTFVTVPPGAERDALAPARCTPWMAGINRLASADPHARWCEGRGLNTPGYPIIRRLACLPVGRDLPVSRALTPGMPSGLAYFTGSRAATKSLIREAAGGSRFPITAMT